LRTTVVAKIDIDVDVEMSKQFVIKSVYEQFLSRLYIFSTIVDR